MDTIHIPQNIHIADLDSLVCVPVESKGEARRCGCPLLKATPATTIRPTQNTM